MNTSMSRYRRWRRGRRRGVSEIIGAILLVALTIVAGVILWTFRINTPPAPPTVSFVIRSGGSNPVWGDPTDCQPQGDTLSMYPIWNTAKLDSWESAWDQQCENTVTGNFSELNSTEFIISAFSPSTIQLSDIELTFICNNATDLGGTTVLLNGSLASMTWFPGVSSQPAADAPYLGSCGQFNAASKTAANGIYYNRLGLFVPLDQGVSTLQNGDTFILYIHNGGYPIDFECPVNVWAHDPDYFDGENSTNGCQTRSATNGSEIPTYQLDYDDYHGAPPWCFQSVNACTIYLTYTGYPSTLLAKIPVYSLAPPSQ